MKGKDQMVTFRYCVGGFPSWHCHIRLRAPCRPAPLLLPCARIAISTILFFLWSSFVHSKLIVFLWLQFAIAQVIVTIEGYFLNIVHAGSSRFGCVAFLGRLLCRTTLCLSFASATFGSFFARSQDVKDGSNSGLLEDKRGKCYLISTSC